MKRNTKWRWLSFSIWLLIALYFLIIYPPVSGGRADVKEQLGIALLLGTCFSLATDSLPSLKILFALVSVFMYRFVIEYGDLMPLPLVIMYSGASLSVILLIRHLWPSNL